MDTIQYQIPYKFWETFDDLKCIKDLLPNYTAEEVSLSFVSFD